MPISPNINNMKTHLHIDKTVTTYDSNLEQYWTDAKHYFDNKNSIFATSANETITADDYDDDVIDLFEKLGAAWWVYWQSPTKSLEGVKEIKKEIVDHLKAKYAKRHETEGNIQVGKTSSKVTGTE